MRNPVMTGERFGRGVVLDPDVGRDRHQKILVRLRCDPELGGCGSVYQTTAGRLRAGETRSCGCLHRETAGRLPVHGLTSHPLYPIWRAMIHRCEYPSDRSYADYGGRGITVWGPWHDPARFIADVEAEIGPRPDDRLPSGRALWTLDRRNNDGNYEPGNIRWATQAQQNRNSRRHGHATSGP